MSGRRMQVGGASSRNEGPLASGPSTLNTISGGLKKITRVTVAVKAGASEIFMPSVNTLIDDEFEDGGGVNSRMQTPMGGESPYSTQHSFEPVVKVHRDGDLTIEARSSSPTKQAIGGVKPKSREFNNFRSQLKSRESSPDKPIDRDSGGGNSNQNGTFKKHQEPLPMWAPFQTQPSVASVVTGGTNTVATDTIVPYSPVPIHFASGALVVNFNSNGSNNNNSGSSSINSNSKYALLSNNSLNRRGGQRNNMVVQKTLWDNNQLQDYSMVERELLIEKAKQDEILELRLKEQLAKEERERLIYLEKLKDDRLLARVLNLLFSRRGFNFHENLHVQHRKIFRVGGTADNRANSKNCLVKGSTELNGGGGDNDDNMSNLSEASKDSQAVEGKDSKQKNKLALLPSFANKGKPPPEKPAFQLSSAAVLADEVAKEEAVASQECKDQTESQVKAAQNALGVLGFKSKKGQTSKIREKLVGLTKFVVNHTSRKVMTNWHIIEARFNKSATLKTFNLKDDKGMVYPVKQKALTISLLVGLLCSPKIRISFNELPVMFQSFDLNDEDITRGRQIAAVKAILGPNNGEGLKQCTALKVELHMLTKIEEKLVSFEELKASIFPSDDKERAEEEAKIADERANIMDTAIEEKRKRDEIREKAEERKKKMISDFEDSLGCLQYPRGPLTVYRHSLLVQLLGFCQQSVSAANADKDISISEELISLLGLDAFPAIIREQISVAAEKKRKADEEIANQRQQEIAMNRQQAEDAQAAAVVAGGGKDDDFDDNSSVGSMTSLTEGKSVLSLSADGATPSPVKKKKRDTNKAGGIKAALSKAGFNGKFRVPIQGPPSIKFLLRETVSYGKGLNGLAYRDVVEMLQAYASTRMQAVARGFIRRWKYRGARDLWRKKFYKCKKTNFSAWRDLVRRNVDTRQYCWRRMTKWRYYTRRMKARREAFRICYWPFYVWRRWSNKNAAAREKAKFLTSRVMPTYQTIIIFKAWRGFSDYTRYIRNTAVTNWTRLCHKKMRSALLYLREFASKRRCLRKNWFKEGIVWFMKRLHAIKNVPFQVWKAYIKYRQSLRRRVVDNCKSFRLLLMQRKKFLSAPNRLSRRLKLLAERADAESVDKYKKKAKKKQEKASAKAAGGAAPPGKLDAKSSSTVLKEDEPEEVEVNDDLDESMTEGETSPSKSGSKIKNDAREKMKRRLRRLDMEASRRIQTLFKGKASNPTFDKEKFPDGFPWRHDKTKIENELIDIHSDGEDGDDLPPVIANLYAENVHPLIDPEDFDFLINSPDIQEHVLELQLGFKAVEAWAIFESSMRMHRLGKRCFQNMRFFAIISRNAKFAKNKLERKWKRKIFDAFLGWMTRDPEYVKQSDDLSLAEVLSNTVRSERLEKLARRRRLAVEVKTLFGRDYDHQDEETKKKDARLAVEKAEKEELKRLREEADERAFYESMGLPVPVREPPISRPNTTEVKAREAKAAAAAAANVVTEGVSLNDATVDDPNPKFMKLTDDDGNPLPGTPGYIEYLEQLKKIRREKFEAPNLLQWDREDREGMVFLAEKMLKTSLDYRNTASRLSIEADIISNALKKEDMLKERILVDVFESEGATTQEAIKAELQYTSKFKIHAAEIMVNCLEKIWRDVQALLEKQEIKKFFRALRMPYLKKRGTMMYNRKRLQNWIRICRRLIKIDERAEFYRSRRTMWGIFNRWLKFVQDETLFPTPGFVRKLKRRVVLHPSFSEHLADKGFQKVVYYNNPRFAKETADLASVFYRWLQHTQEEIVFKEMEQIVANQFKLKTMWKCFWAIRTEMRQKDIHRIAHQEPSLPLTRIAADLDQISKRFIFKRKSGLAQTITRFNRKFNHFQKYDGRTAPSFKKFLYNYDWQVSRRLVTEQRILFESFENRGAQDYADTSCPQTGDSMVPPIMNTFEGKRFFDPNLHIPGETGHQPNRLPGGYALKKLRLNFQDNAGIVGWQVVWTADCLGDMEGPKRGRWNGAAMHIEEAAIPKDDFLIGLEYLYEGAAIMGIRFKCFKSGWGKLVGSKTSLSTLSVYYNVDMAPQVGFEDHYVYPGRDEQENQAIPRTYIIGFCGNESHNRCTNLGLVVRKIKSQHIFSYYWVNDAVNRFKEHQSALAIQSGLTHSFASLTNIPANLNNMQTNSLLGDSLTANTSLPQIHTHHVAPSSQFDEESTNSEAIKGKLSDYVNDEADDSIFTNDDSDDDSEDLDDPKLKSMNRSVIGEDPLSPSEEQFFDIIRMRNTEVKVAQLRVENFSRRLWTSRSIRKDPELSKLATVNIVSALSFWLFEVLCKRLLRLVPSEKKGSLMVNQANAMNLKADTINRRANAVTLAAQHLDSEPKPWIGKSFMSPQERLAKKMFGEKLKQFHEDAKKLKAESEELKMQAVILNRKGQLLLPRMQLSTYVYSNYKLKLQAARNKESLLERMTIEEIKASLCGATAKDKSLSESLMESIKSSLKSSLFNQNAASSLEQLVEDELQAEREKEAHERASNTKLRLFFGGGNQLAIQGTGSRNKSLRTTIPGPGDLAKKKSNRNRKGGRRGIGGDMADRDANPFSPTQYYGDNCSERGGIDVANSYELSETSLANLDDQYLDDSMGETNSNAPQVPYGYDNDDDDGDDEDAPDEHPAARQERLTTEIKNVNPKKAKTLGPNKIVEIKKGGKKLISTSSDTKLPPNVGRSMSPVVAAKKAGGKPLAVSKSTTFISK